MIIFDLKCAADGHVFEAWFANSTGYEDLRARGLLACPICGGRDIAKAVMAPNVPAKANARGESLPVAAPAETGDPDAKALIGAMAKAQAKLLAQSQWVGRDFDAKARAMEAGETERATIHGEVTRDQAAALIEDGIGVMPLPFPVIPPDKRN